MLLEAETGAGMGFVAIDDDGKMLESPEVIGEQEAMLLVDGHHLYRVAPPILPGEAMALLQSAPLPIAGLTTEEGEAAFGAVVGLGVELSGCWNLRPLRTGASFSSSAFGRRRRRVELRPSRPFGHRSRQLRFGGRS